MHINSQQKKKDLQHFTSAVPVDFRYNKVGIAREVTVCGSEYVMMKRIYGN